MKTSRLLTLICASLLLAGCGASGTSSTEPSNNDSHEESSEVVASSEEVSIESSVESSAESSLEPVGGPFISEPTTISIWATFNDDYKALIENMITSFAAIEPKVTVEIVKQSTDYNGLKDMIVQGIGANNYPDIAYVYPDSVGDFLQNGIGLDISEYMESPLYGWSDDDIDDIPEGYLDEATSYSVPGAYSLPACKSSEAMYYNAEALIGLDLSAIDVTINNGEPLNADYLDNLTWEELFEKLCPALDAFDQQAGAKDKLIPDEIKEAYPDWAYVGYDSDDNLFISLAEQYGYGYTSINNVTGVGKLDFVNDGMKDLMKKFNGYTSNHYLATKGTLGTYCNYRSTAGAMLFSIGSTGGAKYQWSSSLQFEVGVANIPHAEGKNRRAISQGPSFAFLDHNDENRALATWLFYKHFANTENNTKWAVGTGYSPIRYSVFETPEYQSYITVEGKSGQDLLLARNALFTRTVGNYLFTSPVFKGSADARTNVGALLTNCLTNDNIDANIDSLFQKAYDDTLLKM